MEKADDLLIEFCTSFEALYGPEKTTINMHLHLHIKDSILDYGPVYAFWLFSYEQYNGILGSIPTNNCAVESQLMKRFVCDQQLRDTEFSDEMQASSFNFFMNDLKGSVASQARSDECKGLGPGLMLLLTFDTAACRKVLSKWPNC